MKASRELIVLQVALAMLAAMATSPKTLAAGAGVPMPGLSAATPGDTALCYVSSTEELGPCAPAVAGPPPCFDPNNRFKDCGDGTVYDKQTGLTWEKKQDCGGGGGAEDLSNPHCRGNRYTWSSLNARAAPTGQLFTDFLAKLNQDYAVDSTSMCFAGHCDWRIPELFELRTILAACSNRSCIDPILGPTEASFTWSSNSESDAAGFVHFSFGSVDFASTLGYGAARAVRSGR